MNLELVGNKYATMTGIFFEIPWALGEIVLGVLAMGIRDYRWYQTVLAAPMIVMLGVFYFIPESPRWLIKKRNTRKQEKSSIKQRNSIRYAIEIRPLFQKAIIEPQFTRFYYGTFIIQSTFILDNLIITFIR